MSGNKVTTVLIPLYQGSIPTSEKSPAVEITLVLIPFISGQYSDIDKQDFISTQQRYYYNRMSPGATQKKTYKAPDGTIRERQ